MATNGAVDIPALLGAFPALAVVRGFCWERALAAATIIQVPDGRQMAESCGRMGHFTLVLQGTLKIHLQSEDGRTFCLYKVHAGEMCALSIAGIQAKRMLVSSVLAEGEVIALRIPAAHLDTLLVDSVEFRGFLMSCMTRCFTRLLIAIEETAFEQVQQRIERELRERWLDSGSPVLRVTHQQLADDVGSTRVVVSRLLKQMEGQGRFKLTRGSIALLPASEY